MLWIRKRQRKAHPDGCGEKTKTDPAWASDWQRASYASFSWEKAVLWPEHRLLTDSGFEKTGVDETRLRTEEENNRVCLGMSHGTGKFSDAGYLQASCWYTRLPAEKDAVLTAEVQVLEVPERANLTFQEAFGVFLRDTMQPDKRTGFPYADMAAAGGYLGGLNLFGHTGVSQDSAEEAGIFARYDTLSKIPHPVGKGTWRLTIGREGAGIWADITDCSGRHLLEEHPEGASRYEIDDEHRCWLRTSERFLTERDPGSVYAGFFTACGYTVCIDKRTVCLWLKDRPAGRPDGSVIMAGPDGSCGGNGTREFPYDLETAVLQKADEIRLLPGRYHPMGSVRITAAVSGTEERPHILSSERGAPDTVIDFGGTDNALLLEGDWWRIDGIGVTAGGGLCIRGSHNTVTHCVAFRNRETGILIRQEGTKGPKDSWPHDNRIADCVSYGNEDPSGHNADGFACKIAAGSGNRFENCLAFLNADDGFDLFSKNRSIGAVSLIGCRSYLNGYRMSAAGRTESTAGNGNGFKLGGSGLSIAHKAEGCVAGGNRLCGFTSNSNPQMHLSSCRAHDNRYDIVYQISAPAEQSVLVTENCTEGPEEGFDAEALAARLLAEYEK